MRLYSDPRSPNCAKVLFAAAHLGVELQVERVDLAQGTHKTAEFRELNPNGRVPVLVDGDFVLWESSAILQYLCSAAGSRGASLLPTDARSNADTMRWLFWSVTEWGPVLRPFLWERIVKPALGLGEPDPQVISAAGPPLLRAVEVVDQCLARRRYLVGEHLTLADIGVSIYLMYAERAQLPLSGAHHLQSWFQRIQELPAWQESQPKSIP